MLSIHLVDCQPIVKIGLEHVLQSNPKYNLKVISRSTQEAQNNHRKHSSDILIFDPAIEPEQGISLLSKLKSIRPATSILVWSDIPPSIHGVTVIEAGASGYVNKTEESQLLVDALDALSGGGIFISTQGNSFMRQRKSSLPSGFPPHYQLTHREFEVLRGIISGKSTADIGLELSISPKTVTTHRLRIYKKIGAKNDVELTRYCVMHSLIDF